MVALWSPLEVVQYAVPAAVPPALSLARASVLRLRHHLRFGGGCAPDAPLRFSLAWFASAGILDDLGNPRQFARLRRRPDRVKGPVPPAFG
jgi:hypothetical protein